VNLADIDHTTPLAFAIKAGHLDTATVLIECEQVDVNAEDLFHRTPLWLAASKGYADIVKALLTRKDIEVNPELGVWHLSTFGTVTPLVTACSYGHLSVVEEFISDGRADLNSCDPAGHTPIHISITNHRNDILRLLLRDPSIDVHIPCAEGNAPLHTAAVCGNLDALTELLKL
ncbi:ankyrin, partial [Tuber magnatum]